MKDHKKVLAFALALSCAAGLASCSSESDGEHGYLMESETTTQHTVELNTETLAPEQEEQVANLADSLPDMELSNKTVKWMSFYDPWHPSGLGNSKPVSMELFEKKYGGDVEYVETTWATQYDDLATAVLGGEGIDFFPGIEAVPKCVISGITQSFDEYVDWENPLWKSVKELNDTYAVGGKHYFMACQSTAGYVVYYNRETIEDLGYDDPKELYEKGEWTMDKFKSMLMDFVDPEAGTYGLDGWFNQTPLYLASGVPSISIKDGKMSNNLMDPRMDWCLINHSSAGTHRYSLWARARSFSTSAASMRLKQLLKYGEKNSVKVCSLYLFPVTKRLTNTITTPGSTVIIFAPVRETPKAQHGLWSAL